MRVQDKGFVVTGGGNGIGREVVLYWRELKANEKVELPLSLVAAIPGQYTAPASRAYLYYTDEFKHWVPGVSVTIDPKN